jgi:beta-lactamase regulating signal transducer with metallopeptidase domain
MHTVLNWVWQGCVVALALFAMLGLLERARAQVRYVVCWVTQLLVIALPLVVFLEPSPGQPGPLPRVPVHAVVSVPDAWWTSGVVMAAVWMAWAGAGTLRFIRAMVALRRARANSCPLPQEVEAGLAHWGQLRDTGRQPRLVVSHAVTTAAVLGCGRPVIAVAPALLTTLDAGELDRVVLHEWAHVQRRDDQLNLLQIAVRIVAGWHPAVWWIDRRLQAEREIACDETAVAVTGAPKSYAACLVKLASVRGAGRTALAAPAALNASGLRARITRIVAGTAFLAPRRSVAFAAVIAIALAMVSVAAAQTRLIEPAAFVLPYESIRTAAVRVEGLAPSLLPTMSSAQAPGPGAPRVSVTAVADELRPAAAEPVQVPVPTTVSPVVQNVQPPPAPAVEAAVEAAEPSLPAAHEQPVTAPVEPSRAPWAEAAGGGKAIGRKSKEAGVATAGAFSRFARRIAGSF